MLMVTGRKFLYEAWNVLTEGKLFAGTQGLKINCSSIIHAAKRNDYDRVKEQKTILFLLGAVAHL